MDNLPTTPARAQKWRSYSAAAWNGPSSPSGTVRQAFGEGDEILRHLRKARPALAPPLIHVDRRG